MACADPVPAWLPAVRVAVWRPSPWQVVDNSSAFRMTEGVPLVIPEVNPEAMAGMKYGQGKGGIIANPNCSTIIALMAVTPLHKVCPVKRMIVSTYQAASGAGQAAMDELVLQTREVLDNKPVTMEIFPFQYAFNLFSHNAPMMENGYNEEEMKMSKETKKIWGCDNVAIAATCIRVPVMRAHAESINLEFDGEVTFPAHPVVLLPHSTGEMSHFRWSCSWACLCAWWRLDVSVCVKLMVLMLLWR